MREMPRENDERIFSIDDWEYWECWEVLLVLDFIWLFFVKLVFCCCGNWKWENERIWENRDYCLFFLSLLFSDIVRRSESTLLSKMFRWTKRRPFECSCGTLRAKSASEPWQSCIIETLTLASLYLTWRITERLRRLRNGRQTWTTRCSCRMEILCRVCC